MNKLMFMVLMLIAPNVFAATISVEQQQDQTNKVNVVNAIAFKGDVKSWFSKKTSEEVEKTAWVDQYRKISKEQADELTSEASNDTSIVIEQAKVLYQFLASHNLIAEIPGTAKDAIAAEIASSALSSSSSSSSSSSAPATSPAAVTVSIFPVPGYTGSSVSSSSSSSSTSSSNSSSSETSSVSTSSSSSSSSSASDSSIVIPVTSSSVDSDSSLSTLTQSSSSLVGSNSDNNLGLARSARIDSNIGASSLQGTDSAAVPVPAVEYKSSAVNVNNNASASGNSVNLTIDNQAPQAMTSQATAPVNIARNDPAFQSQLAAVFTKNPQGQKKGSSTFSKVAKVGGTLLALGAIGAIITKMRADQKEKENKQDVLKDLPVAIVES